MMQKVSIFKKSMMLSKFIYKESSVYHENFDLINENTIWVWHWGKYGKFGTRINLKGEHVSWPETEVSAISKKAKENTRLIKIVKEKYLNATYITNFDSFDVDEWNYFNIQILGNLAFVSFNWNAGDDEGHCGTIEIGYADEDMCYWR